MSSNGEPGGNSNGKGFDLVVITCVVEIFTTEGISFSAKSAKEPGNSLALPLKVNKNKIRYIENFLNIAL
tara:strand:+ start:312 stop:521 length:210 start_codon:yes stop_codon:yes gene_type:complete